MGFQILSLSGEKLKTVSYICPMQGLFIRQTPVVSILTMLLLIAAAFVRFAVAPYGDELVVGGLALLGEWVDAFQSQHPVWGWVFSAMLTFATGVTVGRVATSFSLYRVRTTIAMPLYAIISCGLFISMNSLAVALASYFVAQSIRYLCGGYVRGTHLNYSFYAGLCLGMAPLFYAPASLFVLLLPIAIAMFGFSWREVVVMTVGLVLPLTVACYVGWLCGGEFMTPVQGVVEALVAPSGYTLWASEPVVALLMIGLLLFAVICGVAAFAGDTRSVAVRPRTIFTFHIAAFVVALLAFALPSANVGLYSLAGLSASVLIPSMLVRLRKGVGDMLFVLFVILMVLHFFIA